MGVDHDNIILLSTPFPSIPMLGKNSFPSPTPLSTMPQLLLLQYWLGAIDVARDLHKICLHSTGADINLILSILSNFMNMSSCLFVLSINYLTAGSFGMEQQCWVVGVLTLNASCQSLIHKHVLPGNRIKHQVLPPSDQEMWNWQGAYCGGPCVNIDAILGSGSQIVSMPVNRHLSSFCIWL